MESGSMVRVTIAALITMAMLGVTARAQNKQAQHRQPLVIPSVPAPRDPLPRFTIAPRGGALSPIGLPLPPIGLQPPAAINPGRFTRWPYFGWPTYFFYESQPPIQPAAGPEPSGQPIEASLPPGRLVLDVKPPAAQVFADGYYIGMPEDFGAARGGGLLEAGAHRIDLSAPGYEPIAIDVRVTAGGSLTVRAFLKALPPPEPVRSTTFYLIPGCYMGNIPPNEAHLPPTCDQSRAVTWVP